MPLITARLNAVEIAGIVEIGLQSFCSITGAAVGAASGVWFGWGTIAMGADEIKVRANEPWDAERIIASALIFQSAQYLAGAILLVVGFLLQVLAALVDPATPLPPWLARQETWLVALESLLLLTAIGFLPFYWRCTWLAQKVGIQGLEGRLLRKMSNPRP